MARNSFLTLTEPNSPVLYADRDNLKFRIAMARQDRAGAKILSEFVLRNNGADDASKAIVFALLGQEDQMIAALNHAEDGRSLSGLITAKLDPRLAPFRSHPAFQQLLRRMRVAE